MVCDGMGGAAAGEIASNLAADTFLAHLSPRLNGRDGREAAGTAECGDSGCESRCVSAVEALGEAVGHGDDAGGFAAYSDSEWRRAGSGARLPTIRTRGSSDPPTLWLGHVGDSRCYRRRRGHLEQLTHDHSLVEEQLRAGQITAAQAAQSPMRNLITRAIGSQATVEADIQCHRPQPNDVYLLASDGLTHEVGDEEISEILAEIPKPPTKNL